ncbi:MAG: MMPL family transporter, partial [Gemmataceae bacterium]|nr:MMPL family transporter [Gemmataceae bacterium]
MRPDKEEKRPTPRVLAWLAGLGCRRPWWMLAATMLSCALCLWCTFSHLTYFNQRNDLHGKDKDYYRRWQAYVAEFGDDDDMVALVEGSSKQRIELALEELAAKIERQPQSFDRLFYKVDLRALRNRALLFLPAEQVRAIQEQLKPMALLLDTPVLGGIDPLFAWKSLTLSQLLNEGRRRLGNGDAGPFLRQLDAICSVASRVLDSPAAYGNPWRSILPDSAHKQDLLSEPHYFFGDGGKLAFLLVRPVKEKEGFTFAKKSIDGMRDLLRGMETSYPDLRFGLTGLPVLENDEMVASQNDSARAAWLALAGVALLYFLVYRGLRYPLMTVSTLLIGTVWALGWTTLTIGHLNILSSAFAVMLIGMGDYGVLWVTRYGEERRAGLDIAQAMRKTALHVGPSILTAATTTALAFFAAMLADLQAVAELGWIAGSGVLLCALSCFLVMPALLTLWDVRFAGNVDVVPVTSLKEYQADRRPWLPALKPHWVIVASVAVTLGLGYLATKIGYDHNLLRLQAQHLDSVQWEQKLMANTDGASWHALSYTATPEEALSLKARFEQLPGVSRVAEAASLVPRDQERKLELLADIQARLKRLPERGVVVPHAMPVPEEVLRAARNLYDAVANPLPDGRGSEMPQPDGRGSDSLANLKQTLAELIDRLEHAPPDVAGQRLKLFEECLTRDLAEDLHRLKEASTPTPIHIDDLPQCMRERFIGQNGAWLLRVFAKECLWDYGPLQEFVAQVQSVDREATGKPFTTLEGLRAMKQGFGWAGVYALMAMIVVLLLDFGKIKHMVLALLPLAMGVCATLGLMVLFGLSLNPANMIAFPLILGVGADNGVHVLHDYRSRHKGKRYCLSSSTGRGIMVAALTTILGFGTLMIAEHRGLASLGLVLTLG